MGKVLAILGVVALLAGGGIYYMKNQKSFEESSEYEACEREAKRLATTSNGEVVERIRVMGYRRCLEQRGLKE